MKKIVLAALLPFALNGCVALGALGVHGVQDVCVQALRGARTAQDIAIILQRHGVHADKARELGEKAARGEIVIGQVCTIAAVVAG